MKYLTQKLRLCPKMLFLTLFFALLEAKSSSKKSGSGKSDVTTQSSGSSSSCPKSYVALDGIKNAGNQAHALVRHNVAPGGSFFLMKNTDPSNKNGWVPISQYQANAGSPHDFTELVFPDNYDKNAHYSVMYKNGDTEHYSRPYTCNGTSQWAPSRSGDQDNALAGTGSTTYTSKNLNDKSKGSKKSTKKKNSAASIFCGVCAGLVLASTILM